MQNNIDQRIKTEICDSQATSYSASKQRFYLNSNSKSTERVHKMNKSNENVLQLINLWNQNKNSLSISQKSIPEMKRQTTQVSFHQDSDKLEDQILIHKINNQQQKLQEIQEQNLIQQDKPKQAIINYIKQNTKIEPTQSQKENRKNSKYKSDDKRLKKNNQFQSLILQLLDIQKSINIVYKNIDAQKNNELQKQN